MTPFFRAVNTLVSLDVRVAKGSWGRAAVDGGLAGVSTADELGAELIEVRGEVGPAIPASPAAALVKPATNIRGACWARNSFGYEFMVVAVPL